MALDEKTQKDLHLIFTTSVEDIKFAKKQQWQLTYYALILMGALTYFRANYQLPCFWGNLLIIALAASAIILINSIENDIVTIYRKRLVQASSPLSDQFKNICPLEPNYLKRRYKIGYFLILSITLAIAAILLVLVPPILKN